MLKDVALLLVALTVARCQQHPSPCPRIFYYDKHEPEEDHWHGTILLSTDQPLTGLRLDVQLDGPARILGNWDGEVTTSDNIRFTIINLNKKILPGPATPVKFFIRYDARNIIPRLKSISLNGRQICSASDANTNEYAGIGTGRSPFLSESQGETLIHEYEDIHHSHGNQKDSELHSHQQHDEHEAKQTITGYNPNRNPNNGYEESLHSNRNSNAANDFKRTTQTISFSENTHSEHQGMNNYNEKPTNSDVTNTERTTRLSTNKPLYINENKNQHVSPNQPFYSNENSNIHSTNRKAVYTNENSSFRPSSDKPIYTNENRNTYSSTVKSVYVNEDKKHVSSIPNNKNTGISQQGRDSNYNNLQNSNIPNLSHGSRTTTGSSSSHQNNNEYGSAPYPLVLNSEGNSNLFTNNKSKDFNQDYDYEASSTTIRSSLRPSNVNNNNNNNNNNNLNNNRNNNLNNNQNFNGNGNRNIQSGSSTSTRKTVSETTEVKCGTIASQPIPLVTNGQNTARGQWPWHAALYQSQNINLAYKCGGTLITSKAVLTAAHCVTVKNRERAVEPETLLIFLGKYHLKLWSEGGVQDKQVTKIHIHPKYNSTTFYADIAILILSTPVEFSTYVRPACLWGRQNNNIARLENVPGYVVGWGFDENNQISEELKLAVMPIVSHQTCLWNDPKFFAHFSSNMTFCAGFKNGTSVCNGDSGGGMVIPLNDDSSSKRWYLRGIVSISASKPDQAVCDTKRYVVFTDVALYQDWIDSHL